MATGEQESTGLTRIDRIAKTAFVTALVLLIVVVQQIRERDSELARLSYERRRSAIRVDATGDKLRRLRKTFWDQYKSLAKEWGYSARRGVKQKPVSDQEVVRKALDTDARTAYIAVFAPSLLLDPKVWQEHQAKVSDVEARLDNAAKEADLQVAPSPPSRKDPAQLMRPGEPGAFAASLRLRAGFAPIASTFRSYRELPPILFAQRRNLETIAAASEKARTATQSIPSPFGNFDLNPRLALLFIALATALTYITLLEGARRLLVSGATREEMPSFPYLLARRAMEVKDGRRTFGSIVLHAAWVALVVVMAIACWRFMAYHEAMFVDWRAVRIAVDAAACLVVALFVGCLVTAWCSVPAPVRTRLKKLQPGRRTILITALVAVAGVAVRRCLVSAKKNPRPRPSHLPERIEHLEGDGPSHYLVRYPYVQNRKTLVAHHPDICAHHLPNEANRRPALRSALLHRGREALFLERLAGYDDDGSQIAYLQQAISHAPLSIHLYDKLVRAYGREKKYDQIEPLFDHAIRYVEGELRMVTAVAASAKRTRGWRDPSPRATELTKALRIFKGRKEQVPATRQWAEERRRSKEEGRKTTNSRPQNSTRAAMSPGDYRSAMSARRGQFDSRPAHLPPITQ